MIGETLQTPFEGFHQLFEVTFITFINRSLLRQDKIVSLAMQNMTESPKKMPLTVSKNSKKV